MWTAFLIFLAKQLIQYFLKTNLDLSRQLQESVQRNQEHLDALKNLEAQRVTIERQIEEIKAVIVQLEADRRAIELRWDESLDRVIEAMKKNEKDIDSLSDSDVVRAELPTSHS